MAAKLELLTPELVNRILDEAYQLLMNPGIKVHLEEPFGRSGESHRLLDRLRHRFFPP